MSYIYNLPAGQGHWLGGNNAVARAILSGWRFGGNPELRGGKRPWVRPAPIVGRQLDTSVHATLTIILTSAVQSRSMAVTEARHPLGPTPPVYFNINAFQQPGEYSFGDLPRTNPYRLRNTSGFNENFSLMRDVKIREYLTLHFSADAFNAFNRTQFSAPSLSTNSGGFGEIGGQANTPRQFQFNAKLLF